MRHLALLRVVSQCPPLLFCAALSGLAISLQALPITFSPWNSVGSTLWFIKMCQYYVLNTSVKHWPILIIFWSATSKKLDTNDHSFGHLTLLLLLHYLVKCRLLSLLLAWHQRLPLAFMLEENILSTCCNKDDVT